jgi:hypothetical protein
VSPNDLFFKKVNSEFPAAYSLLHSNISEYIGVEGHLYDISPETVNEKKKVVFSNESSYEQLSFDKTPQKSSICVP